MLTMGIVKMMAVFMMVQCLMSYANGRPHFNLEVSSKVQLNQEIINSAVENELVNEDDNSTSEMKDNMMPFLYRPVTAKNSTDGQSATSIFNACLQACSRNTHSVMELHGCHRECLSDPFKYPVLPEGNDLKSLSGILPFENETLLTRPDEIDFGVVVSENEGGQNVMEEIEHLDVASGEYGSQFWEYMPEELQEGCCPLGSTIEEWGPPS